MADRRRQSISVKVDTGVRGNMIVTAYEGILPEEILLLLTEQSLIFHMQRLTPETKAAIWHGPSIDIQRAIVSGIARQRG
jgi:hypothetical protein